MFHQLLKLLLVKSRRHRNTGWRVTSYHARQLFLESMAEISLRVVAVVLVKLVEWKKEMA